MLWWRQTFFVNLLELLRRRLCWDGVLLLDSEKAREGAQWAEEVRVTESSVPLLPLVVVFWEQPIPRDLPNDVDRAVDDDVGEEAAFVELAVVGLSELGGTHAIRPYAME